MATANTEIRGIVRGRIIELAGESGLPDGQAVSVTLHPVTASNETLLPGEGIRRSAGAWADAGDELDVWLDEMQQSRRLERPELS